jgi:hypothetical protein
LDFGDWQILSDLSGAPSKADLEAMAVRFAEGAKEAEEARARKRKARIWAPIVDPDRPRFSQFFRFVCPFCSYAEEVGLWYTSKTCPKCKEVIVIPRRQQR